MKDNITVFQDDNAMYCFIVGTADPVIAEKALREQENVWYGAESERTSELEKPIAFTKFDPTKLYIRGEAIHWDKEALPVGKGRIAVRDGFVAPLD